MSVKSVLIVFFLTFLRCSSSDEYPDSLLNKYDLNISTAEIIMLPDELKEISGLAVSPDGRVFTHSDESGKIFELNPVDGNIINTFNTRGEQLREDFEGIALAGSFFYLVTSKGDLYEFHLADSGHEFQYTLYKTFLDQKFDVEGLCYNPLTNTLLIACKEFPGKGLKNSRTVYSFSLETKKLKEDPELIISLQEIKNKTDVDQFNPSAIEFNHTENVYLILGGKSRLIAEISPDGKIINIKSLNYKNHPQPEGIAFLPDGRLIISDEGNNRNASLTIYSLK